MRARTHLCPRGTITDSSVDRAMRAAVLGLILAALGMGVSSPPVRAQMTPNDSAAVLVETAHRLAAAGERDLAVELLRYVLRWYRTTPVAAEAAALLDTIDRARVAGGGRTEFVVTNTLIGAWLGVVVPAALGADESPPYGAGLLVGPTAGLLSSLALTRRHGISSGQARAYGFSFTWGSWQALGWREVLDLGENEICFTNGGEFCFEDTTDEAPWVAALVGGLSGMAVGGFLAGRNIPAGDAALVNDAALWGTWFGFVAGVLAGAEHDALLTYGLLGGNGLLLTGIPAARRWRPSVSQVRLVSIAGVAGGLAGLGIDLIAEPDDEKVAVAIPAVGSIVGLVIGAAATLGKGRSDEPAPGGLGAAALFERGSGDRFGVPLPVPVTIPRLNRDGSVGRRPGLGFRLVSIEF